MACKIPSGLVSEHYGDLTLRLHNSTNYQLILTNEVSKIKLRFFLSDKIWFVDLFDFKAKLFFSKLAHIFLDTLYFNIGNYYMPTHPALLSRNLIG